MALLPPSLFQHELDSNGNPLSGGKIYSYEAGTVTPKNTYTSQAGDTANANPIILDANGRYSLWLGEGSYDFVLTDSLDNQIDTADGVVGIDISSFVSDTNSVSANTTIDSTYQNEHVECTASLTLSLLAVADAGNAFMFSVHNSSSGAVTIDPDGSETVNGAASLVLAAGESTLLICDGTDWQALFIAQNPGTEDKTSSFSIGTGERGKSFNVNSSSGAVTVTLPAAATVSDGFDVTIKKTDSSGNAVTIDPNGSETIDGASTLDISNENEAFIIYTDGSNWFVRAQKLSSDSITTVEKTSAYTVTVDDRNDTILCDASGGAFPVNLLPAADAGNGFRVTIKKIDSSTNAVTIDGDSSETLDGATTKLLEEQYQSVTYVSDGTEWHQVAEVGFLPGGMRLVETIDVSSPVANVKWTAKLQANKNYQIKYSNANFAADTDFRLRFGNGGTALTTSTYEWETEGVNGSTELLGTGSSYIRFTNENHDISAGRMSGTINIDNPNAAQITQVYGMCKLYGVTNGRQTSLFGGEQTDSTAFADVEIYGGTQNITSGKFSLYEMDT
jgi:hypothetical protein